MKTIEIVIGVGVVGAFLYALTKVNQISVESVDFLKKEVSVNVNGKLYTYRYGTPGVGYSLSGSKSVEFSSANNMVSVTIKENGNPVRQELVSVVH